MSQTFQRTVPIRVGDKTHRVVVDYSVAGDAPSAIGDLKVIALNGQHVSEEDPLVVDIVEAIVSGETFDGSLHTQVIYDHLLDHAGRVLQRAARPELTAVIELPIRQAFEAWWRETYGSPPSPLRTGMETVPADYGNYFLWFDKHPVHDTVPPSYYHSVVQEQYVRFRAGWQAREAQQ